MFPLQREKLSPEMSQKQWDEEAPQPWALAAGPASHHPCCCADRGPSTRKPEAQRGELELEVRPATA